MDKRKFINCILEDIKENMNKNIDKMPDNWDGWELRQYLNDYISEHYNYIRMDKKRMKNYKKDKLINNL